MVVSLWRRAFTMAAAASSGAVAAGSAASASSAAAAAAPPSAPPSAGTPAGPVKIRIDVVSDTVCPWCFVGKRRMLTALKTLEGQVEAEVVWHPYFLDPTAPAEGVDKLAWYSDKFGAARVGTMVEHMKAVGAAEGIAFSYGGKIARTANSHRLMAAAYEQGGAALQDSVNEALFAFYFEREGNLGDKRALLGAVAGTGLDMARATALLEGDDKAAEIAAEVRSYATRYRITGVPYFIIDGKVGLSGAQEPGTFVDAIREVAGLE